VNVTQRGSPRSPSRYARNPGRNDAPNEPDNPPAQTLDAYKKLGSGFGGLGLGGYLPLGKQNGAMFERVLLQLFPSSGTALSLSAGWAFGA
jgi:hypothetical protein